MYFVRYFMETAGCNPEYQSVHTMKLIISAVSDPSYISNYVNRAIVCIYRFATGIFQFVGHFELF